MTLFLPFYRDSGMVLMVIDSKCKKTLSVRTEKHARISLTKSFSKEYPFARALFTSLFDSYQNVN